MSHSWEPKSWDALHAETKHQLDLKLRQQRVLMSTPCSQSLRPNRLVVSEYEVPNFLGSQEWDIFFGTPCTNVRELGNCKVSDFAWLDPGASICTEKNLFWRKLIIKFAYFSMAWFPLFWRQGWFLTFILTPRLIFKWQRCFSAPLDCTVHVQYI